MTKAELSFALVILFSKGGDCRKVGTTRAMLRSAALLGSLNRDSIFAMELYLQFYLHPQENHLDDHIYPRPGVVSGGLNLCYSEW